MRSAVAVAVLVLLGTAAAVPRGNELANVLDAYRRAQGSWAPGRPQTRILHWSITDSDLTGTQTEVASGDDYRSDRTLGTSTEAQGTLGGRSWSMNANGEVVVESGVHDRLAIDEQQLSAATGARATVRDVRLTGRVAQPFDAYVVRVDPRNGVPEDLYVDARTHLLDERVVRYPGHTDTVTYGDYRTTLGLTFAWHVHESIDDGRQTFDQRLQDVQMGTQVDPARLALPQSTSIVAFAQPRSTLPAKIVDDRIIVPVTIGSHVVNLQLDSGAAGIALDRGIIEALGYAEHGHINQVTAGAYVESDAIVPSMRVGTLTMHDVHVESIPFETMAGSEPVAGLLGFDFIDSVVLHIDYADGTVEALNPNDFTAPSGAVAIPIALDDEVPAILSRIAGASDVRLIVDTGADRSMLFSSFAASHPSAFVDQGLGTELEAASPFLGDFEGVGGTIQYRPIELGPLLVAAWTFPRWLFYVTQDPAKFEIEDYDGLLGQDFLRYYDLYLDYPHRRILLVPNARYTNRFGA